jgi:DNA-3-methyladenine glycosylase II
MIRDIHPHIISHLSKERKLAVLIDEVQIDYKVPEQIDVFGSLIRSIVSQQLSVTAAKTIHDRFISSLDTSLSRADQVLAKSLDELRALGFSYSKGQYVHNVTNHFVAHNLFETDWQALSDDQIVEILTQIKGVGKWTVEMIMMFTLMREDVLPLDDLIIRNHMIALYKVEETRKKELYKILEKKAEKWRPYRSIACRYLWAGKGLEMFKVEK